MLKNKSVEAVPIITQMISLSNNLFFSNSLNGLLTDIMSLTDTCNSEDILDRSSKVIYSSPFSILSSFSGLICSLEANVSKEIPFLLLISSMLLFFIILPSLFIKLILSIIKTIILIRLKYFFAYVTLSLKISYNYFLIYEPL